MRGLLGFTKKAMEFWRNQFSPIEQNTRTTARYVRNIDEARGRGSGITIEGSAGGTPVPVTLAQTESEPLQLGVETGEAGGLLVEQPEDAQPVRVEVVPPPGVRAGHAGAFLAFGSVTAGYALLARFPAPARFITLFNETEQRVTFSFDGSRPHAILPSYSSQDFNYNGLVGPRQVYVKYHTTAPAIGGVVANAVH